MGIKIAPGKAFLFFSFFPTKELDGTADFFLFFFNRYLPNMKDITDI